MLDIIRSMINQINFLKMFWKFAQKTKDNHVPSKSVQKTPYMIWIGNKLNRGLTWFQAKVGHVNSSMLMKTSDAIFCKIWRFESENWFWIN